MNVALLAIGFGFLVNTICLIIVLKDHVKQGKDHVKKEDKGLFHWVETTEYKGPKKKNKGK